MHKHRDIHDYVLIQHVTSQASMTQKAPISRMRALTVNSPTVSLLSTPSSPDPSIPLVLSPTTTSCLPRGPSLLPILGPFPTGPLHLFETHHIHTPLSPSSVALGSRPSDLVIHRLPATEILACSSCRMAAPMDVHLHAGGTDAEPKLVNRLHHSRSPYVSNRPVLI